MLTAMLNMLQEGDQVSKATGWPGAMVGIAFFAFLAVGAWAVFHSPNVTVYQCKKCGNCRNQHED